VNAVQQTTAPLTAAAQQATAPVAPVAQVVQQTVTPVTTMVQQTAAPVVSTVEQTTAPLVTTVQQAAAPVLETTAPLLQTTAPLVTTVDETLAPVLQPALETTQDVLAPVVTTTQQALVPVADPLAHSAAPLAGSVRQTTTPEGQAGRSDGGSTTAPGVVAPVQADDLRPTPAAPTAGGSASRTPSPIRLEVQRTPIEVAPWLGSTLEPGLDSASGRHHATASPERLPGPSAPDGHGGFSVSSAPGGSGSFFVPLFAVLAATLLLAAQGVGRRLRLTPTPPQLPILATSLERPG
jgi:hypothetical protein